MVHLTIIAREYEFLRELFGPRSQFSCSGLDAPMIVPGGGATSSGLQADEEPLPLEIGPTACLAHRLQRLIFLSLTGLER
eukprot:9326857-Pyramimonas_sp.AAC.1